MYRHLLVMAIASAIPVTALSQETISMPIPDTAVTTPPPVVETPPPVAPRPAKPSKPMFRVGLGGAFSLAMHSANQLVLPAVPSCCTGYDGTTGGGIAGGLELALPVSNDVDVITRIQYQGANGSMQYREPTTIRDGNGTRDSYLQHDLTAKLGFLMVEPGVEFRPGGSFGIVGGLRLGTLMSASYTQVESLDPSIPFDYKGGGSTRNTSAGDISQTNSFQFGLMAGLRYHISLADGGVMQMVPEVMYSPMFTDVIQGQSWSVSSLRAGLTFIYSFMSTEKSNNPLRPE